MPLNATPALAPLTAVWLRVVAGLQTCVIPQMFKLGWELVLGPEGDCTAVQSYFAVLPPFVDGEDARKPKLSKTESFSTSPSAIAYVEVLHMLVWSWWVVFGGWWHSPRCALSRRSSRDECAWAGLTPSSLPSARPVPCLASTRRCSIAPSRTSQRSCFACSRRVVTSPLSSGVVASSSSRASVGSTSRADCRVV